ncbi:MAG TPA: VOC family protein [Polyangiaceae bacterium]|nr:VOC family protein [Polyangiaceae bacterium]
MAATRIEVRICIDVDDVERGIAFYTTALPLTVGRRLGRDWVELLGAMAPIDLLATAAGSAPSPRSIARRDFARHWTPVHLDFVVENVDAAVQRALAAGAVLEHPLRVDPYGRLARLADPFGHGLCLIEMNELGYDALLDRG